MATLGIARRVPLAITGAWRRFAQDPARGRAALERALPGLAAGAGEDPLVRFDYAVARDRLDDARAALDEISVDDPARESCALAVDVLAGSLTAPSLTRPRDARGRRAVRAARRQLATLAAPIASGDHPRSGASGREPAREGALGVLHVVTNSLPVTQAGSTIRTQRVARAQRDVGWDARVVTRPGYPITHGDLRSANPQMLDGVPYHRLLPLVMPSDSGMLDDKLGETGVPGLAFGGGGAPGGLAWRQGAARRSVPMVEGSSDMRTLREDGPSFGESPQP